MKEIEMLKVNTGHYGYVAIFTSNSVSALDVDILSKYLCSEKCTSGKILLDLLLVNGNAFNRYVEVYFDGKTVQQNSYSIVDNISTSIKNDVDSFLKKNKHYLQQSILTNTEKKFVIY